MAHAVSRDFIGRCVLQAALAALLLIGGCGRGNGGARPLDSDAFYSRQGQATVVEESPISPVDQPGAVPYDRTGTNVRQPTPQRGEPSVSHVSETVRQSVQHRQPSAVATTAPTTAPSSDEGAVGAMTTTTTTMPTTAPATRGASTGAYLTIGGVIADVNGQPIYADKVLEAISGPLRAKARELEVAQFRNFAEDQVNRQVAEFIRDELEFAAAERALDAREIDLAHAMTERWRKQKITEAGGSEAVAKQRAQDAGEDFNEMVRQKYREHMTQIFYQKRVIPRIQVTAQDMREFYNRNKETEFTEHGEVEFRLIKIDPRKMGGREQALEKIRELRQRVENGADFATIAGSVNHDEHLMRNQGLVGPIQRGAFRLRKVEEAVWQTQPGKMTEIIDADNVFYLAQVERKRSGKVLPFEEPTVQARIQATLRSQQFSKLREQVQERLRADAIIRYDQEMIKTAVEMAMQRYAQWARGS